MEDLFVRVFSTWQANIAQFVLTQIAIVIFQPSFNITDANGDYILKEILYVLIWGSLFGMLSVKGFLILHDCAHNTFFTESYKNELCGRVFSMFEACPFYFFKEAHLRHHVIQGNLDKFDLDSIFLSIKDLSINKCLSIIYLIFRIPLVFFATAPGLLWFIMFPIMCIVQRDYFPFIGYIVRLYALYFFGGDDMTLWRSAKCNFISGYFGIILGMVLFHIQHSFNPSYRKTKKQGFKRVDAAINGAYTHAVPLVLKVFTMGIEYHTLHHFDMMIPGYKLQYFYNKIKNGAHGRGNKHLEYEVEKDGCTKKRVFDERFVDVYMNGYKDICNAMCNMVYDHDTNRYLCWSEAVKRLYF